MVCLNLKDYRFVSIYILFQASFETDERAAQEIIDAARSNFVRVEESIAREDSALVSRNSLSVIILVLLFTLFSSS